MEYVIDLREALDESDIVDQTTMQPSNVQAWPCSGDRLPWRKAVTPGPSIVVNFRSYTTECDEPTNCTVEIADAVLRQGQGMHGSFSRGDTMNFMAAIGPDFKSGYVDALPVSNADVGRPPRRSWG